MPAKKVDKNPKTKKRQTRSWQKLNHKGMGGVIPVEEPIYLKETSGEDDELALRLDPAGHLTTGVDGLGIDFTPQNISLGVNSGLSLVSDVLSIDLDTNPGLVIGAGGIKVDLASSNSGLGIDSDGLFVSLKTDGGLQMLTDQLSLKLKNNSVGRDANGLYVKMVTDGGVVLEEPDGLYVEGARVYSSDPVSPRDGSIWYNSSDDEMKMETSTGETVMGGVIYRSIASSNTVSNTTSETNFNTTFTVPANVLTVGRVVEVWAWGIHSTNAAPTLALRIYLGNTQISDNGPLTTVNNASDRGWYVMAMAVIRTAGSGGTVGCGGLFTLNTGETNATQGSGASINTTTTNQIRVTAEWGTAHADNDATLTMMVVRIY